MVELSLLGRLGYHLDSNVILKVTLLIPYSRWVFPFLEFNPQSNNTFCLFLLLLWMSLYPIILFYFLIASVPMEFLLTHGFRHLWLLHFAFQRGVNVWFTYMKWIPCCQQQWRKCRFCGLQCKLLLIKLTHKLVRLWTEHWTVYIESQKFTKSSPH